MSNVVATAIAKASKMSPAAQELLEVISPLLDISEWLLEPFGKELGHSLSEESAKVCTEILQRWDRATPAERFIIHTLIINRMARREMAVLEGERNDD